MAFFDWNKNGKYDSFDMYVDYKLSHSDCDENDDFDDEDDFDEDDEE